MSDETDAPLKNETPNERFVRIGKRRVSKILDDIRKLSNLASPNYKSELGQRMELVTAIRHATDELEACFAGEKVNKSVFQFKSEKMKELEDQPEEQGE